MKQQCNITRIRLFLVCLCLSVAWHGMGQISKAERIHLQFSDLTNFYRIDSMLYRSDQPSHRDFVALEKFGIREVLNLRAFHSDTKGAKGTTLLLHHLPTHAFWLSEDHLVDILRVIRDREGPMLVHCYHGSDRTGIVVALYRMVFQNVPKETAIAEMHEAQFGHHDIFFNITRLLKKVDVEKIRKELGITISD